MDIIIERGKTVTLDSLPNYSIALDGFVQGPIIDAEHCRFSFDHHAGCLRFCTTSACMQTWTAINLGLDPTNYTIYANDVDVDVCLSIWCLKNPERCSEPLITKLVNSAGLLDMHGGAFPVNGMMKVVEWISEPETSSKRNDDYGKLSDNGLYSLMEAVLHRIDTYADGEASIDVAKQQKHGEYKILRNENGWLLVESHDPHCYSQLYKSGFDKIVLVRRQDDGSLAVSIAKKSDFISGFNIVRMIEEFNKIEPGWGGGSSIAGCVRNHDGSRSRLNIETIIEVIDSIVQASLPAQK